MLGNTRNGNKTPRWETRDRNGIYHKKRQPREAAQRLRGGRRVRQSQAVAVGGTHRPRQQRLHQRNHPPRRHGGQARRHAAAAQRARDAGRPRAAGRPRQGARLPRSRIPLGHQLRGEAPERNRLLRGGCLPDRGKGQAARSCVARRARGHRRDGIGLPVRADEEPAHRGAPAAAQADAVGAAALRPHGRREGGGARPRHRPRDGPRARPGQSAGQRLHARVPGRTRARTREGVPRHHRQGARAQGVRGARHGLVPVGDQRQRAAAALHRVRVHAERAQAGEAAGAGGQGHHVRHRRHLAQARPRHGPDEVRHVRRGVGVRHAARHRRDQGAGQRRRPRGRVREHAVRAAPPSPATS